MGEQAWEDVPEQWRDEAIRSIEDLAEEASRAAEGRRILAAAEWSSTEQQLAWAEENDNEARALRAAVRKLGEA